MSITGDRIKELRDSSGYGVDEFARILKISRSTLYRYEGTYEPKDLPISIAIKIAEMYNVSLDWIAGISDIKYRKSVSTDKAYESLSDDGKKQVNEFTMFVKSKEGQNNGK